MEICADVPEAVYGIIGVFALIRYRNPHFTLLLYCSETLKN